jgi:hypothetical protein
MRILGTHLIRCTIPFFALSCTFLSVSYVLTRGEPHFPTTTIHISRVISPRCSMLLEPRNASSSHEDGSPNRIIGLVSLRCSEFAHLSIQVKRTLAPEKWWEKSACLRWQGLQTHSSSKTFDLHTYHRQTDCQIWARDSAKTSSNEQKRPSQIEGHDRIDLRGCCTYLAGLRRDPACDCFGSIVCRDIVLW